MCGIIAVLRRTSSRPTPVPEEVLAMLARAEQSWSATAGDGGLVEALENVAGDLDRLDGLLRGAPGVEVVAGARGLLVELDRRLNVLWAGVIELEHSLDSNEAGRTPAQLEVLGGAVIRFKDALWAITGDRLRTIRDVLALAGPNAPVGSLASYLAVQEALSGIDRLEVRGRDSAGRTGSCRTTCDRTVGPSR